MYIHLLYSVFEMENSLKNKHRVNIFGEFIRHFYFIINNIHDMSMTELLYSKIFIL